MSNETLPLTLLVLTYNEAGNIARCLDSVPFAAEKIVIDCGSTDATAALAEQHRARVVTQPWLGFGPQRRFATGLAAHPWILFLDADEWLSEELIAECRSRLPALLDSDRAGARLARAAWFMGARMRWYRPLARERIERLYHRDRAAWTDSSVHEALRFNGPFIDLSAPLLHAYTPTLVQRVLKDTVYAELRAREWQARGRASGVWLCPLIYLATFFKDYILRLALLDGARGYVAAHLAATYAVYKRMRYREMILNPSSIDLARDALLRHGLERPNKS